MLSLKARKTHFNVNDRTKALKRLESEKYDVIIIGGGITGMGIAVDAASRGLRTALVERVDIAAGTSRWSSKLVHGGLRYLAKGDVGVAWESANERAALMTTIAPHLTKPAAFMVPLDGVTGRLMGILAAAGTFVGDVMRIASNTPRRLLPPPTYVTANDALLHVPSLKVRGLRGGLLYWDGQLEDDARLVISMAATAHAFGADIVTRCAASDVKADRVTLTDTLTGKSFQARGLIINATGVWVGEHEPSVEISPSRGSHIVVPSRRLGYPRAVFTAPVPGHFGRYVFGIPQDDELTYIGLTDEPAPGADGVAPGVPEEDEAFLLRCINQVLQVPLTSEDIVGRFAGLRPLVRLREGATPDISRKHLLIDQPGKPITIAGGKLTTYRRMAQDTVDAACKRLGIEARCRTRRIPLSGAASRRTLRDLTHVSDIPQRLVRRYGMVAPILADLIKAEPDLGEPVVKGCATLKVELAFAVLAEGALTVEDLLERRTRISMNEKEYEAAYKVAQEVLDRCMSQLKGES